MRRQIGSLWLGQVVFSTIVTLATTVTGLAGFALAPAPWMATLPIALGALGTAAGTIPVGRSFAKYGRKKTLIFGAILCLFATTGLSVGVALNNFSVFTLSYLMFGCATSFTLSYRFTATRLAPASKFALIHAYFVAAGLVASLIGPMLATLSISSPEPRRFLAAYVIASVLAVMNLIAVSISGNLEEKSDSTTRKKVTQPSPTTPASIAVLGGGVATGAMLLAMLSTPLLMPPSSHGMGLSFIMMAHFAFMYLPGLFGVLAVKKLSLPSIIGLGAAIGLVGAAAGVLGADHMNFLVAMILYGASWGVITVASATIISQHAHVKLETRYNLSVASIGAAVALSVAPLSLLVGWININAICAVLFFLLLCASARLILKRGGSNSEPAAAVSRP